MPDKQFQFNFSEKDGNTLKIALNKGDFSLFFEINTPEKDCNLKTSVERWSSYIKAVEEGGPLTTGITVSDRKKYQNCYNIVDFANELGVKDKTGNILFISGRGRNAKEIYETFDAALSYGFNNIVPVTGESLIGETVKDLETKSFYDSVNSLLILNDKFRKAQVFQGAVVNPFKYTPDDLYPQYFKLMKKINLGANYIFTQTGWDLLKLQELRWYLEKRNLFIPTIARFYLLKPDYVENIISGKIPGVCISPDFLSILRKESRFGLSQFMAAQWRKLQLLVSGAKLLGYSGAVIAGIDNVSDVNVCKEKTNEAFKEFSNFEDWRDAYSEYLSRAEMAPYPYRFYIYKNLLKERYSDDAKEGIVEIKPVSKKEKTAYFISKNLWNTSVRLHKKSFVKRLLYRCRLCDESRCHIREMFFVCYRKCPKKLINGACGGTKPDGTCEVSEKECIFSKIFRLANWKKKIDLLEEKILD